MAPQSLHKYLYAHADPIQGTDPTGKWTLVGVATSIGTGVFNAVNTVSLGYGAFKAGFALGTVIDGLAISRSMTLWEAGDHLRDAAWETMWVGLGLFGFNQATLRATSALLRLRHTRLLANVASNSRAARQIRGVASFVQGRIAELYIAQKYTMWRNGASIGRRIPDFIGRTVIREVKNVQNLSWTPQIATFANRALRDGKNFVIHVRSGTNLAPRLINQLNRLASRGLKYEIVRDIPNALRAL